MVNDLIQRLLDLPKRDQRIVSCRLGGSYSTGKADQWSDIDLKLTVGPSDKKDVIERLPGYIAEIEPVVTWHMVSSGETIGATNWPVPRDFFFFFLQSGTALELGIETGIVPSYIRYGRYRPVLLALWSVNFRRCAQAIRRGQKERLEEEMERVRVHLAHIGLGSLRGGFKEIMDYAEEHGEELCSSAGEEYPAEVVRDYRKWIKAILGSVHVSEIRGQ
jgi:hypothetical protein